MARTHIDYAPFLNPAAGWFERGHWPAKWISFPKADAGEPIVQAFRRTFRIDGERTVRIHVSADERYELFLDGRRIGRGPERGDRGNWCFETYDLPLAAGEHTLVARSWWLGPRGHAPVAQMSVRPGFVLAAEKDDPSLLNTGVAPWTVKRLEGYRFLAPPPGVFTGPKYHIDGRAFAWDFERGMGDGWVEPQVTQPAIGPDQFGDQPLINVLRPAMLPPMIEQPTQALRVRHVQAIDALPKEELLVRAADHRADEVAAWDKLLAGGGPLTVPPHTARRLILDRDDYFCAYLDLVTTGGAGAVVHAAVAEALFHPKDPAGNADQQRTKGNRDEIDGRVFIGVPNIFEPDGGDRRAFDTLWWEAGRYIELIVLTAEEPLTIENFSLRETHYPLEWRSQFEASEPRIAELLPITRRVMEMCSHETLMDCPYYEQLMYVGDTRVETLVTYACCGDDRLGRKAMRLLDASRRPDGFTLSRYPASGPQLIPPFSAWWVAMAHDFAMWRDDAALVRELLPGVRGVLDAFVRFRTDDGLIAGPYGWNFVDWAPGFPFGMAPGGDTGEASAPLNFHLAWVFQQAAELEQHFGEPELATLHRRRGGEIARAAVQAFWNEDRGLFADDRKQAAFSEHAQCLAVLSGAIGEADDRQARLVDHLFTDDRLTRTTIYFSHYLFETCALVGRMEPLFERLKLWFELKKNGFRTTFESPEPSRSDCHAWGAHPMFHFYATILGIRPSAPAFARATIRPQLGPLEWARGTMTHPRGMIEVDVKRSGDRLTGRVTLPAGVSATLIVNGETREISGSAAI